MHFTYTLIVVQKYRFPKLISLSALSGNKLYSYFVSISPPPYDTSAMWLMKSILCMDSYKGDTRTQASLTAGTV